MRPLPAVGVKSCIAEFGHEKVFLPWTDFHGSGIRAHGANRSVDEVKVVGCRALVVVITISGVSVGHDRKIHQRGNLYRGEGTNCLVNLEIPYE